MEQTEGVDPTLHNKQTNKHASTFHRVNLKSRGTADDQAMKGRPRSVFDNFTEGGRFQRQALRLFSGEASQLDASSSL